VNLGRSLVTAVVLNVTSKNFITNVFYQLWSFLDSFLIQNLGDFIVHREKTMFLNFHNKTYVFSNVLESVTIFCG
jgi:hypothetical protein